MKVNSGLREFEFESGIIKKSILELGLKTPTNSNPVNPV